VTDSKTTRRRLKKAGFSIVAIGLAAALVLGLLPKPIEVDEATVQRGPLVVSVLEEGKTRIRKRYIISSAVAGQLQRVPVRAGDPVVAGETVLAVVQSAPAEFLDPRARARAEAAVRSAEAVRLQRAQQVETAASELDLARKELTRAEKLRETGAIAIQTFDAASNKVSMLTSQLGSARFAMQVADYELEQAKATLLQGSDTTGDTGEPVAIRSPVTGFVLNVHEESARTVTPGLPIMEVGDPTDLEAEIELLSSDAVNVRPGAPVSIEQWGGGEPLAAEVVLVEPGAFLKVSALGVEEQRVKVRVRFLDLPPGLLGDRYRVEARIVVWKDENVLQVPTGALFRKGNEWMAFHVENGRAQLSPVSIGKNNGIFAEVQSGLSEGDRVILYPPDTVQNGVRILPRNP
jgi:HlyD family secretion protein